MRQPRYSWASSILPLTRFDFEGALDNGRNANILVAGTNWIARQFTEAPIRVWKTDERGATQELFTLRSFNRILERPNPYYSGIDLISAMVVDLVYDGNAYARKLRNNEGIPVQLWWMPSWTVEPKWDAEDPTSYIDYYEYKPDPSLDGERVPIEDVVHVRWHLDPKNPRKGMSAVKSLLREVYTDEEASAFASSILRNMGVPGVILAPEDNETTEPLTKEEAEAIKLDFKQRFGGDRRGEPMVMDAALKVHKLSFSPEELNLTALRRIPEERVAAVLGIYPEVLGFGSGKDNSDFTEMLETSYQTTIMFIQRLFQPALKYQLLSEFVGPQQIDRLRVVFDNTNVQILARLMNEKAKRYGLGILYGWTEVGEGRHEFGLPVRESDRVYLRRKGTYAVRDNNVIESSLPGLDESDGDTPLSGGPAGDTPEEIVESSAGDLNLELKLDFDGQELESLITGNGKLNGH